MRHLTTGHWIRSVSSVSIFAIVFACSLGKAAPNPKRNQESAGKPTAQLITAKETYDGQPAVCTARDGKLFATWVAYAPLQGDTVVVSSLEKNGWTRPETVNSAPGQIVRPSICALGDTLFVFWTETGDAVAKVLYATRTNGKWSKPQTLSDTRLASQNQEVATDGKNLFVTWQEFHDGQYDVVTTIYTNGQWSDKGYVTNDKYDDWDPAIVCDSQGDVWVAWTSYREGDYDLYVRQLNKRTAAEKRVSARGEYDLHPAFCADSKGGVWLAWDCVTIPRHGSSGGSTITGANLAGKNEPKMNDPENPDQKPLVAQIRLIHLKDGVISHLPKSTKALQPPAPYKLAHTALPKVSVSENGTLWVAYRALMVDSPANAGKEKGKGKKAAKTYQKGPYWWDVFAQSFGTEGWSAPVKLPNSDGTLEEVAIAASAKGLQIAYQMEHRLQNSPKFKALAEHAENDKDDHHHDYGKVLGSNGDIYFSTVAAGDKTKAAITALVKRPAPLDKPTKPRLPRDTAHYTTEVAGQKYTLLWGDLHKHSNISRCSSGNEPSPDDHYKYANDVCQYDFVAMTDHAEHSSDFNWWRIQKLADLYNVPGYFSVLYGYEWSARFPIGHHNVIFPSRPSPLLRCNIEGSSSLPQLWKALADAKKDALTIPHTLADPGMGTRWEQHNETYRRVAEIFQACRGSYEYDGCPRQHSNATAKDCFYQDGLAKGYKLGIICSSDHGWGTAYAVVYATENSRQAAFQGMKDRRSYGSTTYGLVVDFRMGDHMMGEEFSSDKPEPITVFARGGSAAIRQIDIFSDGKLVHSLGSEKKPIGTKEARLKWTPPAVKSGTSYFYARVIQEDDEIAWASPVWVSAKKLKVSEAK